jgi:deoxyinosine 3'endonuclease (endonuclease V)
VSVVWFGRAGVASHIGVQLGVPTIGVAKNLHLLAEEGEIFEKGELYRQRLALLSKKVPIGHG